ncbi:unnamed protein product [Adineta ricciae]|uniref:Roadblock/LAMTOR2 domain-containing protein n=1 Tax=Adineta ricciae TaxID=249248 RepID=A0A814VK70_ADIRI|nr:unnamed protein product [Adineta ricciae]
MHNHSSLTNRADKKQKRSFTQPSKSSQLSTNVPVNEQNDISVKTCMQSCTYRLDNIDRSAIIKRQEIESSLKRLSNRDDVYGVIVTDLDGRILHGCEKLKIWIPSLVSICLLARHFVRNVSPDDNDLQVVRLRTKTYEIVITIHNEQLLIVMQIPSNGITNEVKNDDNHIEEDWEAFLERIKQQMKKD